MNVTKVVTVVFAMLAAAAVTTAATAQQDGKPDSGSMMEQKPGGGSMMEQKPGGDAMMGHGKMMGEGKMMGQGKMMGEGKMMGQGMMGGMGDKGAQGSMMCGRMVGHIEGRLAFLKTELKITAEQETLWNAYASAVRDNAKSMTSHCASIMDEDSDKTPSLPDRLDAQEQFMLARLDALRAAGKALKPLYAALSDEQKQLADQFIRSSTGMM